MALAGLVDVGAEVARATQIAANHARDWLAAATKAEAAGAGSAAPKVATEVMRPRVVTTAATETADAYNTGRAKYLRQRSVHRVELYRIWDATLDKRTCPTCSAADGTIVGLREPFPLGRPGGVHPRCRCTESLLRGDEVDGELLIQPVRFRLVPAA